MQSSWQGQTHSGAASRELLPLLVSSSLRLVFDDRHIKADPIREVDGLKCGEIPLSTMITNRLPSPANRFTAATLSP
jgi:hypothetical protein